MKLEFFFIVAVATLFFNLSAGAATVLKCAVKVVPNSGARINLLQGSNGNLRANLIFGTTVSGSMYNVVETAPGVYVGSVRRNPNLKIQLVVSTEVAENYYIRGFKSALEVIYKDQRQASGIGSFKSKVEDEFTCGVQKNKYGETPNQP